MFSKPEKDFIWSVISSNLRIDGRKHNEFRNLSIQKNTSTSSDGSATIIDKNTDTIYIISTVKLDFCDDSLNLLECNVKISPVSSSNHINEIIHKQHSKNLFELLNPFINKENSQIVIEPNLLYWKLFIDVNIIKSDGNEFDLIGLATISALGDTKIPKVKLKNKFSPYDIEIKNLHDYPPILFNNSKIPFSITLAKFDKLLIVDPVYEEEKSADCLITISIDKKKKIHKISKDGKYGFNSELFLMMMKGVKEVSGEIMRLID